MKSYVGSLALRCARIWVVITVMLGILPAGAALAQQAPPGTSSKYLSRFQVSGAPAQFDLIQAGADFNPGISTADFAYSGPAYNTVMAGEVTVRQNGADKVYKAGETWTDAAGQAHAVSNNGKDVATVYTSILLPKGAGLTTGQQAGGSPALPPGPATLFVTRYPVSSAPSPLDVVQVALMQAPGSWTAVHTHPGAAYNTVIQGKLLVRADGKDTTYGPGQSWVNPQGQVHAVQNPSTTDSLAFTTFLVPHSATQVSTAVADPPSALPVTGVPAGPAGSVWLFALGMLALATGATLVAVRRRLRSA